MYEIYALSDRLKRRNFDALDQWLAYTKGKIRPQSTVKRRVSHRFRISLSCKSQCVGTFSLDVGTLEVPSENFVTSTYLLGAYLTHTDITTQSDGESSYEIEKLRKRTFFGKWSTFLQFDFYQFTIRSVKVIFFLVKLVFADTLLSQKSATKYLMRLVKITNLIQNVSFS